MGEGGIASQAVGVTWAKGGDPQGLGCWDAVGRRPTPDPRVW